MPWTQEKLQTILENVVIKAQKDPLFREKLKSNPKEALAAEAGEMIPEFIRIAIVDQNDTDIVITLPKVQSDELSDADLEHVAGGKSSNNEDNCDGTSGALAAAGTISVATGGGAPVGAGLFIASGVAGLTSILV